MKVYVKVKKLYILNYSRLIKIEKYQKFSEKMHQLLQKIGFC